MKIFSYRSGSRSAKALGEALKIKKLKHKNSKWKPNKHSTIINWGTTQIPSVFQKCHILNRPEYVRLASNKLAFFRQLEDQPFLIPEWADNIEDAKNLFQKKDDIVVCRTVLAGHSGKGIVLASSPDELVDCKLYVKYVKKMDEYRVHVIENEAVDVQRKARRKGAEIKDTKIRNVENGYVYVRGNVSPPRSVLDVATSVIPALNLVFGAVDVVYNRHHERAFALEVNTAPGLEGQTIETYAKYFAQFK